MDMKHKITKRAWTFLSINSKNPYVWVMHTRQTRRAAIESFCEGSTTTWAQWYRKGYRCVRCEITVRA